ncbi:7TM diverse intracellular signaling domain-containing protein [Ekhidna sp.]|uniref:7TM diverse intracellular signaling domain-containing protein n=1 Tax=Ekhidna sp. TaxID=2608089 RepID=UPI003514D7A8
MFSYAGTTFSQKLPDPINLDDISKINSFKLEERDFLLVSQSDSATRNYFGLDSLEGVYGIDPDIEYSIEPFWLIFQLENSLNQEQELYLRFPVDIAKLITIDSTKLGSMQIGGFYPPIKSLTSMHQTPPIFDPSAFIVSVPPDSTITIATWVGGNFLTGGVIDIELMTRSTFLNTMLPEITRAYYFQVLFVGMMFLLAIFNFLIFVGNRDRTYLFYSLYVVGISLYFFSATGLDRYLFAPDSPFGILRLNLTSYSTSIFYPLFCLYFLHRDGWKPRLRKAYKLMLWASIILCTLSSLLLILLPSWQYKGLLYINQMYTPVGLISVVVFLYSIIVYVFSKNVLARYIGWGGLVVTLFGSLQVLRSSLFAYEAYPEWAGSLVFIVYGFQIGTLIQALVFALALSYRSRKIEMERAALLEIDRTKTRFFANISHEFKTPLSLIIGPAGELLRKAKDDGTKKLLTSISQNAQRLLKLINEILDLSKIEAGQSQLNNSSTNVVDFVEMIVLQFQSYAEARQQQLTFTSSKSECWILTDQDKLEKVLINLISNACKYTPAEGTIQVEVLATDTEITIRVVDSGMGISSEHLPHIFDRFYHVSNADFVTDQSSTGIGLALSKELVQVLGGTIEIKSDQDEGTESVVFLPFIPADPVVSESSAEIDQELNDKNGQANLLLIEDNVELRAFIKSCLPDNLNVLEAEDGEKGVNVAISQIPDIIVTDVMMPKKDGLEVCKELKSHEATNHIPVVILTGKSSQSSRLEGLESNADAYLSKPFDADELRLVIRNLLASRDQMKSRYSNTLKLEASEIEVSSQQEIFLKKAIEIVEQHMADENFSVEELSSQLALDRTQLFRKLKALTGESPSTFIRTIRLKRAHQLLNAQAATVSEIAYATGFSSPSYFIKCYKEQYGHSPGKVHK